MAKHLRAQLPQAIAYTDFTQIRTVLQGYFSQLQSFTMRVSTEDYKADAINLLK